MVASYKAMAMKAGDAVVNASWYTCIVHMICQ